MAEKPKKKKQRKKLRDPRRKERKNDLPSDARLMLALALHEPRISGERLRLNFERLLTEYEGDADRAADDLLRRFRESSASSA